VCLLNASRGEVIDNKALFDEVMYREINQELAIKLVLDVWENEPNLLT
jgi:phosphoglycerate dehydrogenase-like enzyme